MKVNVPLLDATRIGVSPLQKNFNIAGNIIDVAQYFRFIRGLYT